MSAYRTVVVGTDGSPTSLRAVTRAAGLAGACGARLLVACAYEPAEEARDVRRAMDLAAREEADLSVVGNRGLDTLKGRLLGSVPSDVTRRSEIDVLVVHTTG